MDASLTRFSPDGRFLAVGRMSEDVVELWNLEDGKNIQRFPHPPGGNLSSLQFSPTGDTLIAAAFREPGGPIYGSWPHLCLAIGRRRDGIFEC